MTRATCAALLALAAASCTPRDHSAAAPVPLRLLGGGSEGAGGSSRLEGVVDAWAIEGTLYALEPSPPALVAIDMATGARRFRRPLSPKATGPFQLVKAGRGDAFSGLRSAPPDVALFTTRASFRYDADGHLVEANQTGIDAPTHIQSRAGVCSVGNACAEQLFDCETARPIGPVFRGGSITLDGEQFVACAGARLVPVGRSEHGLLFVNGRFEDLPGVSSNQADSLVSIDPATGALRFVSALWREIDRATLAGIDPSGRLVTFVMTNGDVVSYQTNTGVIVATTEDHPPNGAKEGSPGRRRGPLLFTAWVSAPRPTLLANFETAAEIVDVATGEHVQIPLRRGEIALVGNARLSPFSVGPTSDLRLKLVDPSTGETRKTLRVGVTDGFGSFGASGLIEVPDRGRAWRMDLTAADLPRSPANRLEAQRNGMHTLLFDRYRAEPVLSVDEDAWVIGVERCSGRTIAAIGSRAGGGGFDVRLLPLPD